MTKNRIIGVIGNASLKDNEKKRDLSFQLGKLIIDNGYSIATGGMGGIMEIASSGAKNSSKYQEGSIIGVLPDYSTENMNEYVDIVIPTGMGLGRNIILASMCDAVIAIGGGAGTLSEMALAWQMGKLIIALDSEGWSSNLKSVKLDKRRPDKVFAATTPDEAIKILNDKIDDYPFHFSGVKKSTIDKQDAINMIKKRYETDGKLEFLGSGDEGYVFRDDNYVFKIITNSDIRLYWRMKALSEDIDGKSLEYLFPFDVDFNGNCIFIRYDYVRTQPYRGGKPNHLVNLAKELKSIGWVYTNFHPKNIRIKTTDNKPIIVDIGYSFEPYSNELFRKMCRRMFVSSLIGDRTNIEQYLSETNHSEKFMGLKDFDFKPEKIQSEFKEFFNKINTIGKKDILNPMILSTVEKLEGVNSILDFGSGHGDISKILKENGYKVTAYDPNSKLYEKYKERYYKDIPFLDRKELNKLTEDNSKFDMVILSLVLCSPLISDGKDRESAVNDIMNDVRSLSNRYVLVAICNPLYTNRESSIIQDRFVGEDFSYHEKRKITKKIHVSNNKREDYHRPLSYYEQLFLDNDMKIKRIDQTQGTHPNEKEEFQSDFMLFLLEVM